MTELIKILWLWLRLWLGKEGSKAHYRDLLKVIISSLAEPGASLGPTTFNGELELAIRYPEPCHTIPASIPQFPLSITQNCSRIS